MRIAAIDLGSNTFHLIIAECLENDFEIIFKTNKPIKLSEDITKENRIIPAAFHRGLACLLEFKSILDTYQVDKLKAVATSAVRSAKNGEEFVNTVKQLTNIDIDNISGEEEATLIFESVKASGAIQGRALIMDIGGGSTEFIFCDEKKAYWKKSYDIGAARLMQKFFKSDPINRIEIAQIQEHLAANLSELITFNETFGAETLIGSAGAFETYLEMTEPHIDLEKIKSTTIDWKAYKTLSQNLIDATHKERSLMPNLTPLRVDMIVMATIQTNFILQNLAIEKISMTTYDLKYGILHKICKTN